MRTRGATGGYGDVHVPRVPSAGVAVARQQSVQHRAAECAGFKMHRGNARASNKLPHFRGAVQSKHDAGWDEGNEFFDERLAADATAYPSCAAAARAVITGRLRCVLLPTACCALLPAAALGLGPGAAFFSGGEAMLLSWSYLVAGARGGVTTRVSFDRGADMASLTPDPAAFDSSEPAGALGLDPKSTYRMLCSLAYSTRIFSAISCSAGTQRRR